MSEAVDIFLDYIALEKSLSRRTVSAYARDLAQIEKSLATDRVEGDLSQASADSLSDYFSGLAAGGLSTRTIARKQSAVRGFFRFLAREGRRKDDPSEFLTAPRGIRSLPGVLSVEQAGRLVEAWDGSTPLSTRNRALLELAYGAGLRESELAGITVDRVFLEELYVRPLGKGSKERIVPIGGHAAHWLRLYIDEVRPSLARSARRPELFLTRSGRPMSRMTVWNVVRQAGVRSGIGVRVYPHILRHSFATHLLQGGADLRAVQELLGHADIRTTEIYTNVDRTYLSEVLASCHPRAARC
jgi:integrase/recombinase XerD